MAPNEQKACIAWLRDASWEEIRDALFRACRTYTFTAEALAARTVRHSEERSTLLRYPGVGRVTRDRLLAAYRGRGVRGVGFVVEKTCHETEA